MSLEFLNDEKWDFAFFKKLAANDTGSAPGHQGGMVIPKNLRPFFPTLIGQPTSTQPSIDRTIKAELIVDGERVDIVNTRYQIQSWGGTRQPESRITSNLGPLRNAAHAGDFLIIQRSLEDLNLYRLCLVTQTSSDFNLLGQLVGKRPWGTLYQDGPLTQKNLQIALREQKAKEEKPFILFDEELTHKETRSKRIARSIIFSATVRELYNYTCAVCKNSLKSPKGLYEISAAHIVPRSMQGSDDPRNGIALCRTHHWSFDHGLFYVDESRKVIVPESVFGISSNKPLFVLHGEIINEAQDKNLTADSTAFKWHVDNILIR